MRFWEGHKPLIIDVDLTIRLVQHRDSSFHCPITGKSPLIKRQARDCGAIPHAKASVSCGLNVVWGEGVKRPTLKETQ
jgi:hypothetical protein